MMNTKLRVSSSELTDPGFIPDGINQAKNMVWVAYNGVLRISKNKKMYRTKPENLTSLDNWKNATKENSKKIRWRVRALYN